VLAGMQPFSSRFVLEAETVKAASKLGARIVLTVYAPWKPSEGVGDGRIGSKKATRSALAG
jgi:hypothetical protein